MAASGLAIFVWLACVAALATAPPAWDLALRDSIHALASPGLTTAARALTAIGGGWFLWALGCVTAAWLWRGGRKRDALWFAVTVLGAHVLELSLKLAFHRARPPAFFGYEAPANASFPSGHALAGACFYLALADALRGSRLHAAALLLAGVLGFTRVYLGVHYPSDVMAGYALAAFWYGTVQAARNT